ncbi:MAG: helicase C-terminal domain-containing protein [Candidatus Cloacimonadota bacterium]|nr:helicase C-terminal domain-containing protein [Candidatus Cloacimonadota bacterium]
MEKYSSGKPQFDFIAVDVETTGLNPKYDKIIEIGAAKFKDNQFVEKFQSFINIKKKLPANIKTLTNISDENLETAPFVDEVMADFIDFIGDEKLCFHNASFDMGFINHTLEKLSLASLFNNYFDTLEISRIFTPHRKSHSLDKLCEYFQIENPQAHRADNDAKVTGQLFAKLIEYICENFEANLIASIDSATSLAEIPTLLKEFTASIQSYLTKSAFQRQKKIGKATHLFPITNCISNLDNSEKKLAGFTIDDIVGHFEKDGSFPSKFDQYEFRQGQIDMATYVGEAFDDGKTLIVEAGTGVGKSFAYLIPAILFSKFSERKVVISTNTKNLQEQLFYKDIPTLQQVAELTFDAVLLKGRRNYLCLRKWDNILKNTSKYLNFYEKRQLLNLFIWAAHTNTGDIEENHSFHAGNSSLWSKIASDGTSCYGRNCPFYHQCFTMNIRKKAERTNLVIINHALLIADAVSDNSVIGSYEHLVIDEAHNLPHTAAVHFGFSVGLQDIYSITKKILTTGEFQYGISTTIKTNTVKSTIADGKKNILKGLVEEWTAPLDELEEDSKTFFSLLNKLVIEQGNYGKLRFKNLNIFKPHKDLVENINTKLAYIRKHSSKILNFFDDSIADIFPNFEAITSDLDGLRQLILELQDKFKHLFVPDFEDFAFWLETSDRKYNPEYFPRLYIVCAPIEVNNDLFEYFWSKMETTIITSATLAIRSEFKFYKHLTGLDMMKPESLMEFIASSPFDYEKQMRVIIPSFLPSPKDRFFSSQAISLIEEILSAHARGTLVLFTSYKDLDLAYESLAKSTTANNITLLAQGKTGSRTGILEAFRKEENSVLLGTKSFWEGVDVKGKSLEILILYRLPFLVPKDPLVEASLEKIEKAGKNSFMHYSLPISLLHFKQGFGRLIRNKTDNGVIVILDNRIITKRYGSYYQKVMPVKAYKPDSDISLVDHITNWFEQKI